MKLGKSVQILGVLAFVGLGYVVLDKTGYLPGAQRTASAVPEGVSLSGDASSSTALASTEAPLPSGKPAAVKAPVIRINIWEWNAQMGLLFANGGAVTTTQSLMEKHGVSLKIIRQDDTNKSMTEQVTFATALAAGQAHPGEGIHFTIIMGDQAAGYLASINKLLDKLGPDYRAEIIGAVGRSLGEDGYWGPAEWRDNPEAQRGGVVAGVLREGDWNIVQYKLANDGIKNNPDETTYDPDAMNWVAAGDYLKAVELYVQGYCEDRKVVRSGKVTSEKKRICVQGVTTWTPGDVNLAKQKGGLVRLLSTAENVNQMPAVVIGIKKWDQANAKKVEEFLAAALEGGDQVKAFPNALLRAGQAAFSVYADQSAGYWVKYYKGVTERDKTQQPVPLGGSSTMNLADNLLLFGMNEGAGGSLQSSVFNASYTGFGNVVKQQYPELMPTFPTITEAVNLQYLNSLTARMQTGTATVESFDETKAIEKSNVVARKNWNIQFETGRATFTPAALGTLQALYDQLVIGGALAVEVSGHTDNVGDPVSNRSLSLARADAVRRWLQEKAPTLFPENRVIIIAFGDTQPIATNTTPEGRAQNRRVTITLGVR